MNQYIIQRTLGSKSLAEGQKGIVFAAFLKLIIPFVVVIPGILAFNMFSKDLHESALGNNAAAIKLANEKQPFVVGEDFVRMQPKVAAEALAINARLAGEASGLSASASTREMVDEINRLSDVAVKKGNPAGPKLVAYDFDSAFPVLLKNLIKPYPYISWFVLAAIFGAVVSSLASMLNSASTIATIDLYQKVDRGASQHRLVMVGRFFVVLFVGIASFIAPMLSSPHFGGIFTFIQEFQGFISPGVLAVFLFGVLVPRAPRFLGWSGILLGAAMYGALMIGLGNWIGDQGLWFTSTISFLDRMAISFVMVVVYCLVMTLVAPLKEPVVLPVNESMNIESSMVAKVCGIGVVVLTGILYFIFW